MATITEYQNGAAIWFEAGLNRDEVHKAFSIWQDDPARISYGDPARVDSCTYEETGKPTFYTLTAVYLDRKEERRLKALVERLYRTTQQMRTNLLKIKATAENAIPTYHPDIATLEKI